MAAGDPLISVAGGASLTLNGALSDAVVGQSAGVTITGPGTLTLKGANTYTGPTVLQGGLLQLGNASALGASASTFTVAGGTITDAGANIVVNHGFTIAGAATIAPVHNLTFAGPVAYATGSFLKVGAGTLTFNTPTVTTSNFGNLSAQAGTVAFDGVVGTVYNLGTLNVGTLPGTNATMTVNNVKVIGTGITTIAGYWHVPVDPATRPYGTLTLTGSATAGIPTSSA